MSSFDSMLAGQAVTFSIGCNASSVTNGGSVWMNSSITSFPWSPLHCVLFKPGCFPIYQWGCFFTFETCNLLLFLSFMYLPTRQLSQTEYIFSSDCPQVTIDAYLGRILIKHEDVNICDLNPCPDPAGLFCHSLQTFTFYYDFTLRLFALSPYDLTLSLSDSHFMTLFHSSFFFSIFFFLFVSLPRLCDSDSAHRTTSVQQEAGHSRPCPQGCGG